MMQITVQVLRFINLCCLYQNLAGINGWTDNLIEDVRNKLKNIDSEFIQVPDFKREAVKLVGKIPVKLRIIAIDGILGELTSLKRIGDVQMSNVNEETTITLPLCLGRVGLHFEDCFITYGSTTAKDMLEVKVPFYQNVMLNVTLLIRPDSHSSAVQLKDIVIQKVRNVEIILTEYCVSEFNEKLYNWITDYLNDAVQTNIKFKFIEVFTQMLKKYQMNQKLL